MPWYEEAIDLAQMFRCAPEDPYDQWDRVWLNRARVILRGRHQASLDTDKKINDGNQGV